MSAPTSEVEVCNLTLDHLKMAPIVSIDTPTDATESVFARWYDALRRSLLRAHTWNFALKRDVLTTSIDTPAFGYSHAYNLPNDFLRFISLGDDSVRDFTETPFEIENGQLLISNDANDLSLRYIFDNTTVSKFDPMFVDVLSIYMAVRLSNKFNIAASLKTELKKDFQELWAAAISVDGQERPPIRIQRSRFLSRRRGLSSSNNSNFVVFD